MTRLSKKEQGWAKLQAEIPALAPYRLIDAQHVDGIVRFLVAVPTVHKGEFPTLGLARYYRRPSTDVTVGEGRAGAHTLLVTIVLERRETALDKMVEPPPLGRHSIEDGTTVGRLADGSGCKLQWVGGHTLVVGTTNSGKSTVLRHIAADITWCHDAELIVLDAAKQGRDYQGLAGVRLLATPAHIRGWLTSFEREATARKPSDPQFVVLMDEYMFCRPLAAANPQQADQRWVEMASLLRGFGVTLIVGCQRGTTDYLPSSFRTNCQQKVVLATESDEELRYAAGGSGPAYRPSQFRLGEMAVRRLDNREWVLARAWSMPGLAGTRHLCNYPFPTPPWAVEPAAPPEPPVYVDDPELDPIDRAILDAINGDAVPQNQVADRLGVHASTISRRIDSLARRGLVDRPHRPRRAPLRRTVR